MMKELDATQNTESRTMVTTKGRTADRAAKVHKAQAKRLEILVDRSVVIHCLALLLTLN
jgi:hypothetical protein